MHTITCTQQEDRDAIQNRIEEIKEEFGDIVAGLEVRDLLLLMFRLEAND